MPIAVDAAERIAPSHATGERPLLIVPQPLPLPGREQEADEPPRYGGALQIVAGPERIEAGWWDLASPAFGQPRGTVARDYFVARNRRGQTLWVYRGRDQAVRLPKGYRFEGEEVYIKRVGEAVVLLKRPDFGQWRGTERRSTASGLQV